jgi:putative phosphoesterase
MLFAAEREKPDIILHLGDHIGDAYELRRALPGVTLHAVAGNCDAPGETERLLTLEGVRVWMTHGHLFGVKGGLDGLISRARGLNANLALYGHTHIASNRRERGLWLMNPGQLSRHDGVRAASYGVVTAEDGSFVCDILTLPPDGRETIG